MIGAHNYCYGQNLPEGTSKVFHAGFALLILAGPVALYLATGSLDVRPFLLGYVGLCLLVGALWVPYVTWTRWRRRDPAVQVEKSSRVVDLRKELGYRPVGGGRVGPLPYLPYNEIFTLELVERTLRLPRLPKALDGCGACRTRRGGGGRWSCARSGSRTSSASRETWSRRMPTTAGSYRRSAG
jgi:hypothetical protein